MKCFLFPLILLLILSVSPKAMSADDFFDSLIESEATVQGSQMNNEPYFSNKTNPLSNISTDDLAGKIPWVHGFEIMDLEKKAYRTGHNENRHPESVASVIKLPVVNIALKEIMEGSMREEESMSVKLNNVQSYDGEPVDQKYTVKEAIHATLYRSSNTCPNLLADKLGGLNQLRVKLSETGYRDTGYNYLSSIKRTIKPKFQVGSTASDLAISVHDFYHTYRYAQDIHSPGSAWYAFTHTKYKIPVTGGDNIGGKIGTNSRSSTYAGIYKIEQKYYIIVTLIDKKSFSKSYSGPINATSGDKALIDANQIIVNEIRKVLFRVNE